MEINPELHTIYQIRNAPKQKWPFPHFYVENVFSPAIYPQILRFVHEKASYSDRTHAGSYANRAFSEDVDIPGLEFLRSKDFLQHIMQYFQEEVLERFPDGKAPVYRDLRLIRDCKGYKIGPHTDAVWKMVSLLFYLPSTNDFEQYGTSIFVPKQREAICNGGPHHHFEPFDKVYTAPYRPNSCFGFWKTNRAFHGVEPITVDIQRDVLLFNIYRQTDEKQKT